MWCRAPCTRTTRVGRRMKGLDSPNLDMARIPHPCQTSPHRPYTKQRTRVRTNRTDRPYCRTESRLPALQLKPAIQASLESTSPLPSLHGLRQSKNRGESTTSMWPPEVGYLPTHFPSSGQVT